MIINRCLGTREKITNLCADMQYAAASYAAASLTEHRIYPHIIVMCVCTLAGNEHFPEAGVACWSLLSGVFVRHIGCVMKSWRGHRSISIKALSDSNLSGARGETKALSVFLYNCRETWKVDKFFQWFCCCLMLFVVLSIFAQRSTQTDKHTFTFSITFIPSSERNKVGN
jgi:hypothetical protein